MCDTQTNQRTNAWTEPHNYYIRCNVVLTKYAVKILYSADKAGRDGFGLDIIEKNKYYIYIFIGRLLRMDKGRLKKNGKWVTSFKHHVMQLLDRDPLDLKTECGLCWHLSAVREAFIKKEKKSVKFFKLGGSGLVFVTLFFSETWSKMA